MRDFPWIKSYCETRTDPKLRSLSRDQRWVWYTLLLFSSEQPRRGTIEWTNDEVLAIEVSDGDVDLLNSTIASLISLGILAEMACESTTNDSSKFGKNGTCPGQSGTCGTSRDIAGQPRDSVPNGRGIIFKNFDEVQLCPETIRKRKYRKRMKEKGLHHPKSVCPVDVPSCPAPSRDVPREGELDGDLEELKTPPLPAGACARETVVVANPPTLPSTPRREPEDQAEVDAACALLGSTLGSEHLAMQIGQQSDIPGMIEIEGWKFHEAAKRLLDPAKARGLRGNWKYYLGIVRGLRDDERPNSARAAPSSSTNGHATPRRTLEETTEDYGRMMREAKAAERRARGEPEMTPEYKAQLAQYNEIMRKFHERRL